MTLRIRRYEAVAIAVLIYGICAVVIMLVDESNQLLHTLENIGQWEYPSEGAARKYGDPTYMTYVSITTAARQATNLISQTMIAVTLFTLMRYRWFRRRHISKRPS